MKLSYALLPATSLLTLSHAQAPPPPQDQNVATTSFFNHSAKIQGLFGQSFLLDNIPFIDIPDHSNIESVYYYRFSALQRHLHYATPGTGYVITEFVQPIGYAGSFDTIDAAAGHQIEEARWLRSSYYAADDIQIWTRGPGSSIQYTNWIHHAAWGTANVTGDAAFLNAQLDGMLRMWHVWDPYYNSTLGLYFFTPDFDAQEYSLPGFIAYAASGSDNATVLYVGPQTYRPSHNAYMVAAAHAIAAVASAAGNQTLAAQFTTSANTVEAAMYKNLWSTNQSFFVDNIEYGYPAAGQVAGREEVGFFPFRFGVGLQSQYMNPTLQALHDPEGFNTTYYPPTLEQRNMYFTTTKPTTYCCYWQGQNWPYSTAHFLKSLAAIYRSGVSALTADQYYAAVSNYATTQHKNGLPYVAESHFPTMDAWSQDATNHSEHYQHSTNGDIVLTGLLGIIPRSDNTFQIDPILPSNWTYFAVENLPYHGFLISIVYDRTGTKYNVGSGVTIYANGNKIYNGKGPSASVALPSSTISNSGPAPTPIDQNIAVNAFALGGVGAWPRASATYTWYLDDPYKAIDGFLFYDEIPDNRWTNYQNPPNRPNDTLTIQLQRPRNLTGVALAIFSDIAPPTNGSVACPAAIEITDATGQLLANATGFAANCRANDINVVAFGTPVLTDTLHLNFFSQPGFAVGLTELQLWVPAPTGPLYYAADALPAGAASVAFDPASRATANGAVVQLTQAAATLAFSGLYAATAGPASAPALTYRNNGTAPVTLAVALNQVPVGTVALPPTAAAASYARVALPALDLARGTNFLTLSGGAPGLLVESVSVAGVAS